MANVTWDGETSANWFTGTNWNGNFTPGGVDDVFITNGSLGFQPTVNNGSTLVNSVAISAGILTLSNFSDLFAPNIIMSGTGSMTINFGCVVFGDVVMGDTSTLTQNGTLNGNLTVNNGTMDNNGFVGGTVTVNGGAMTLNAGTDITNTVTVTGGTLSVNASDTVAFVTQSGGTIQGIATLTTGTYTQSGGTLDGIVSASGAKTLNGGTISGTLQGAGATTIQTGTTTVSGTIVGNVTVASSGTLRIDGATAVSGTITAQGSTISYADLASENSEIILSADGTDFEVLGGDAAEHSGVISQTGGSMGLNKTGAGTLTLTGANTYGGVTHVIGGTLVAGHADALSDLLLVTNAGSTLDLGGNSVTAIGVIIQNGTISNGTLTVTGNSPFATQLGDGGTISANVAGAGGITVGGAGTNTLSGNNTYTGQTIVNTVLSITSDSALGSTVAGTLVNTGGVLQTSGGITVAEAITLNGTGLANGGALRNISGFNVVSGAITLGSATQINSDVDQMELLGGVTGTDTDLTVGGAGIIIIGSAIATGSGNLTKDGTGILALYGINTFTGATTVNAGFLQLLSGSALADNGALTVNMGATVQLLAGETVGALSGSGTIVLQTTDALVVGDGTNTEFSGAITEFGAIGEIIKGGSGTLTLSGTNTYTGATTVSAGTLALSGTGSISNSIVIALATGTTFDISGTTTGATIVDLYATSGAASVVMGGRSLSMTGVAGTLGPLTLTGGTGIDALSIALVSTLTDFSLAGVAFANWTANVDTISLTGNALDNVLTGSAQHDSINGGDGNDVLNGGLGVDAISGGNGNDTINGGLGTETLFGDAGNDLFILGDGEGNDNFHGGLDSDTVDLSALVPFNLEVNLAAGTWGSIGSIFGVMNGIENIIASVGNDILRGNAFANNLSGGDGEDNIFGAAGADILTGGNGSDRLYGGVDADQHIGGNDAGIDYAAYNDANHGNLTIRLDNSTLNVGAAAIGDTYVGIEGLIAGIGNDTVIGNASVNYLHGLNGNDTLNGLGGTDFLYGGSGDDTYALADGSDVVSDTSGIDTIQSSITRNLGFYAAIENLTLIGSLNINGTGNALANRIVGNTGNNILNGGTDSVVDILIGGAGDDTYLLGAGSDSIIDISGTDTINSSITRSLGVFGSIENLTLSGTANINGTGNLLANRITGNSGNNSLNGGLGSDVLTGGAGIDSFIFNTAFSPTNIDRITDYNVANDTIRVDNAIFTTLALGPLAAAAFASNTTGLAGDASDRIIYESDTGRVFYDADGLGGVAAIHFATLSTGLALTQADFVVF